MTTRHSVATRLVLLAAACHLALGAERPEACPAEDPGDGTPWWGQKCGPFTCGEMYEMSGYWCTMIESGCWGNCGSPCCRAAPASPAPPSSESSPSPSVPPSPSPSAPPSPVGHACVDNATFAVPCPASYVGPCPAGGWPCDSWIDRSCTDPTWGLDQGAYLCELKPGCKYFIYGVGSKRGQCWQESNPNPLPKP